MLNIFSKSAVLILLFAFLFSCGKKEDKTTENKDTSGVSKLVSKDPATGKDKVQLKYNVKKGDKFIYKLTEKNSVISKDMAAGSKELVQESENTFFYSKECTEVDPSGIITFKVKYDSIKLMSKLDTQMISYDSNIKDTSQINLPLIKIYNSMINEPFYIRVSQEGEITDVYGLEKIHENAFKSLGDTLKEEEKEQVKEMLGKESIQQVLQQEYQVFPKQEIIVDSSWIRSTSTQMPYMMVAFDVLNSAKYTLKSIDNKNNHLSVNIEAGLNLEFLNKEVKQKGYKFTVENSETNGTGTINVDLGRGCVSNKQTSTSVKIGVRVSSQGQSAKSEDKATSSTSVTLLN